MGQPARRKVSIESKKGYRALEVIVVTKCQQCGKKGGVRTSMENHKSSHDEKGQLWAICTGCIDSLPHKEGEKNKSRHRVIMDDNGQDKNGETSSRPGFLLPRLLD